MGHVGRRFHLVHEFLREFHWRGCGGGVLVESPGAIGAGIDGYAYDEDDDMMEEDGDRVRRLHQM